MRKEEKNIYFVTSNQNKFKEGKKIIPQLKILSIDLVEIQEINPSKIISAKLKEAQKKTGLNSLLVEDTSLFFDCFRNKLPGPLVKWFLKAINLEDLFKMVQQTGKLGATAQTWLGFLEETGRVNFFKGEVRGEIVFPRGKRGFGWDAIFQPEGFQKTFAQLRKKEKNKISMRKLAFNKLKKYLENKIYKF